MSIRYAIFDLDHTLIRSENQGSSWQKALDEYGVGDRFEESWSGGAGRPLAISASIALQSDNDDPRNEELVGRYWDHVGEGDPEPLEGAHEALDELRAMGIRLFLSTGSYPDPVAKWLSLRGWSEHFELVLASPPESPKGAGHYDVIIEYLGIDLATFAKVSLTVGDGDFDMQYGRDHGVAYRVGYAPLRDDGTDRENELRESGANVIIRSLHDLPRFVEQINAESL